MELTGLLDLYSGLFMSSDNYNVSSARMNLLAKLGVLMRKFIFLARCFAFFLIASPICRVKDSKYPIPPKRELALR